MVNLNDTVRLPDLENKDKHTAQLSFTDTELCRVEVPIGCNANVQFLVQNLEPENQ